MLCRARAGWLPAALLLLVSAAQAAPLADPGERQLRHDLLLLADAGVIDIPLNAWPIPWGDLHRELDAASFAAAQDDAIGAAIRRVRLRLEDELETDFLRTRLWLSGSAEPRVIRTFENTPREQGEIGASVDWLGERFAIRLAASYVHDPADGDDVRPDGSYVGVALGNWMLSGGWQERWWGPGHDGSLILSTNARPAPGITLQRIASLPFESRLLRWVGPWTFTAFMSQLDDERVVKDARLLGARFAFRPPKTGLEIGISRTAQWCGEGRPCDLESFINLLLGRDNKGVNIDPEDEPGNQLGGFDIRWRLPRQLPVALYMQWIGEDSRGGGGAIGSWLRQLGMEHWGTIGGASYRVHAEAADTACGTGGFGFSPPSDDCAYEHEIYQTGYRYKGRAIGHSADGDSRVYSLGSTLVQSGGHSWNLSLRHMEINRLPGNVDDRHSLSSVPLDVTDLQLSYENVTRYGRFYAGLGAARSRQDGSDSESDFSAFLRWSNQ